MYEMGEGVPENYIEALKWYRMAAEQGDAEAQYNLGVMYNNGKGVPENKIMAYFWSSLAKTQGDEDAVKYIEIVKKDMTYEQIAEAQALAARCFESNYKDCD